MRRGSRPRPRARSSTVVWLAAVVSAGAAVASNAAGAPAAAPPPVVEKLVQRFSADAAGVIASRQTVVVDQKAPGHDEHDEQEMTVLQQDRKGVGVRFHRIVSKGRALGADELAKQQEAADKRYASEPPKLSTRFSLPQYPEAVADYTFSAPKPCAGCGETIDFSSAVKDERHGHGTLTFDPATSRISKIEFVPNVPPKPASTGKATYTYGRHDDGSWGIIRIEEHYEGHVLLISGSLDRTTTVLRTKHFATLDEARRAAQSGSL